ncbi:MAG: hypothetical protein ACTS6G_02645 [Candidatus Hodgkinia cicadicola]
MTNFIINREARDVDEAMSLNIERYGVSKQNVITRNERHLYVC